MRTNLQAVKVIWILAQGIFLPTVLWLDDLRASGNWWAVGAFVLLEVLYLGDAVLFLKIFNSK